MIRQLFGIAQRMNPYDLQLLDQMSQMRNLLASWPVPRSKRRNPSYIAANLYRHQVIP